LRHAQAAIRTRLQRINDLARVGKSKTETDATVVVLPAPLGPDHPRHSPRATENDKAPSTTLAADILLRCSTPVRPSGAGATLHLKRHSSAKTAQLAAVQLSTLAGAAT
jgi:hypothetical protein